MRKAIPRASASWKAMYCSRKNAKPRRVGASMFQSAQATTISVAITSTIALGLFVTVYTNLLVVSWKELLLLYLHLDNVVPVLLAALVSFYELMRFMDPWPWYYY